MSIFDVDASTLFAASLSTTAQSQTLAMRALNSGLEAYVAKNYDAAIVSFRRAASLYTQSDIAKNAYEYMARSYAAQGEGDKAIKAYKESLRMDPAQPTVRLALANQFYAQERYPEAVTEYEKAAKLDPSAANLYSLGQGYMAVGRYEDAEKQFTRVKQLTPREPEADVAMGQALAKQGREEEALKSFQHAIDLQRDYWNAYSEMGYVLADNGKIDEAREIVTTLQENESDLAGNLDQYIYEKAPAQMTQATKAGMFNAFPTGKGPGTQLASLDSSLTAPGASSLFALTFSFDKPMERSSIQDVANWSISRAYGGLADTYNFGMTAPTSEITLPEKPEFVFYDDTYQMATVVFRLTQNETGNGTLDPYHVQFSFNGQDVLGTAMDESANDYTGFSGFA
ncbi:MAG: tetratricopeptide repeat protein [Thiobacillus sp.]|nr:tetratricopeptide repeat protein [Thiobacillus sp.]